jgi:O-antigen ligase
MNWLIATTQRLPRRTAALTVLALALPQVYLLPRGTTDVALSTVVAVLLIPTVAVWCWRNPDSRLVRSGLLYCVIGLVVIRLLALSWSPDAGSARQPIVIMLQFAVVLVVMANALREDPGLIRRLTRVYWPGVIAEAVMVVVFRFLPGVEHAYLKSVAGFFMGHNTAAALFGANRNNVLDPAKAGGVFVNANVAAMFLGISGLAACAIYLVTRQRFVLVTAIVALGVVPLTGSKSATALAVVFPAAVLGIYHWRRSLTPRVRRYALIGGGVAVVAGVLVAVVTGLLGASMDALLQRTEIWAFGAESFVRHPILGLGYGGWEDGFVEYAKAHGMWRTFPPHNLVLSAWSTTGIVGLLLTLAVLAITARIVIGALRANARDPLAVLWAGAALAWVWVQGMGENTDVFGSIHTIPIVALLTIRLLHPGSEEDNRVAEADLWNRETSVVPAVRDVHHDPGVGAADISPAVRGEGHPGTGPGRHRGPERRLLRPGGDGDLPVDP